MNRKSIAYSGILLLALILTSIVLNKDVVRSLTIDSEVTLSTTESTHLLGQDVVFNGSLVFTSAELATIDELPPVLPTLNRRPSRFPPAGEPGVFLPC